VTELGADRLQPTARIPEPQRRDPQAEGDPRRRHRGPPEHQPEEPHPEEAETAPPHQVDRLA
jgi:hypothetical protein